MHPANRPYPTEYDKKKKLDPLPVFILGYYLIINSWSTALIFVTYNDKNGLSSLLAGGVFFKFLFCLFSNVFFILMLIRDRMLQFGPLSSYMCGIYFSIFTLIIVQKVLAALWFAKSWNTPADIFASMIQIISDIGYDFEIFLGDRIDIIAVVELCIFLLIAPGIVLGPLMVKEMHAHYIRTNVIPDHPKLISESFKRTRKRRRR